MAKHNSSAKLTNFDYLLDIYNKTYTVKYVISSLLNSTNNKGTYLNVTEGWKTLPFLVEGFYPQQTIQRIDKKKKKQTLNAHAAQ